MDSEPTAQPDTERRSTRWPYTAAVQLRTSHQTGDGQLTHFGPECAFVRTAKPPSKGEYVYLRVLGPSPELELEGKVRWSTAQEPRGFEVSIERGTAPLLALIDSLATRERSLHPDASVVAAPRLTVRIPVGIESGGACADAELRDISLSGARVEETDLSLEIGARVHLTFALTLQDRAFHVPGRVVRCTSSGGYAIAFDLLSPRLVHTLGTAVERAARLQERDAVASPDGPLTPLSALTSREIRENAKRFDVLTETVPDILFATSTDGASNYASSRFYEFTGLPPEVHEGYGWTAALHPDDLEPTLTRWKQSVESGEPFEATYRFRAADGSHRWFLGRARPIRKDDGRISGWFGACSDIHDLVMAQDALREADRRKNEFVAMLAHELRNPLAPIRAGLELLQLISPPHSEVARTREMIERQVKQLVRLVDDLLDVSRLISGKIELRKEKLELSHVIRNALETAEPLFRKDAHRVSVSSASEPLWIEADGARMAQVLSNVLANAAKFTLPGGSIQVSTESRDGQVVVRVRDTGIGLAADACERIFDLFAQEDRSLDRSQGGLGIGLTLARRLVEMHGGRIVARSAGLGRGSEFEISLPALVQERPQPTSQRGSRTQTLSPPLQILIVEDNVDAANTWRRLLELLGNRVIVAHDGVSALRVLEESSPHVALVDIGLPGMSGYEVAQRISQSTRSKSIHLIAVTGYGGEEDKRRALASGFKLHLVKPVDLRFLRSVLQDIHREVWPSEGSRVH